MTIDEAREIIKRCTGDYLTPTENEAREAKGFILGWNAAVKKSAEIAERHERDPELGEFGICSKEILKLSIEEKSK